MRRLLRETIGLGISALITLGVYGLPLLSLVGASRPTITVVEATPDYFAEVQLPADVFLELEDEDAETEASNEDVLAHEGGTLVNPTPVAEAEPAAEPPPVAEPTPRTRKTKKKVTRTASRNRTRSRSGGDGGTVSRTLSKEQIAAARARHAGARKGKCSSSHDQVARASAGRYVVDRDLVEHYTSSIANFNTLGWSKKYRADGEKGWQISGFGCNSPLYFGGLRRGDVIQSVNGRKTNTVLQVLGAYTTQKKKDAFDVVVLRNGKRMTFRYTLT